MTKTLARLLTQVEHAGDHIAKLRTELANLVSSTSPPFRLDGAHDADFMHFTVRGYSVPVPDQVSLIARDAIHSLRAPLDHMMWALAEKEGISPTNRDVAFLACQTPAEFSKAAKRKAPIDPMALRLLESLQPYHASQPIDSPLYVLADLDNRDKHKLLLPMASLASLGESVEVFELNDVERPADYELIVCGMSPPFASVPLAASGTDLFTVDFGKPSPHIGVRIDTRINIALADAGRFSSMEVDLALRSLSDVVARTLNLFGSFF